MHISVSGSHIRVRSQSALPGVAPVHGEDRIRRVVDRVGAENVTLLSDQLWKARFGADDRVLGTAVQLKGTKTLDRRDESA